MPTLMNHSHYWQTQAGEAPEGGSSSEAAFPVWQAAIAVACELLICFFQR